MQPNLGMTIVGYQAGLLYRCCPTGLAFPGVLDSWPTGLCLFGLKVRTRHLGIWFIQLHVYLVSTTGSYLNASPIIHAWIRVSASGGSLRGPANQPQVHKELVLPSSQVVSGIQTEFFVTEVRRERNAFHVHVPTVGCTTWQQRERTREKSEWAAQCSHD